VETSSEVVQTADEAAQREQCSNRLKQIGLAMHNYHDTYRCFPPAVITDEDGQPMRSWRVAILPFIEQMPLYEQYDFSEPWDGPHNRALHGTSVATYRCPSDAESTAVETSYVMIVGEGTLGGNPNEMVRLANVTDGSSNTILAIEVAASGIHWMEPRDVTVEEAVTFITNPAASQFQQAHPDGVNVVLADGSTRLLAKSMDPQVVRWLLTRDDGHAIRGGF
jgi:prepilin-type processing-associated H-X9-DG protein